MKRLPGFRFDAKDGAEILTGNVLGAFHDPLSDKNPGS
jgi:hypothetical protein